MPTKPPLDPRQVLGLPPGALPRHVAIIMDGNGRWARQRNLPRIEGHRRGAESVGDIVEECARLGVECLTLYSFSMENWRRPEDEVSGLMSLYAQYLALKRPTLMENDIRLLQLGRMDRLPPDVLRELEATSAATRDNRTMTLCLALNYGSRTEIVDAVRAIAEEVKRGVLQPGEIDDDVFAAHLYTAGLPDPDLVIRTAGEMRISNFLLWQISYAELYVTPVLWPDFRPQHLHGAFHTFARRERRFGDVQSRNVGSGVPADKSTQ
jgi:undecaprenyl diphosphate synthase